MDNIAEFGAIVEKINGDYDKACLIAKENSKKN